MTNYTNDGHTLYWVIENGELVECFCEHLPECMTTEENPFHKGVSYDTPDPAKCNVAMEEEGMPVGEDNLAYGTPPPWDSDREGAFRVNIEYYYHYSSPSYPDYEADWEFDWKPVGEIREVTYDE